MRRRLRPGRGGNRLIAGVRCAARVRSWPIGEDFGPRQTGPVIEVLRPSAMLSGVGGFGLDRCYYLRAFGRRGLYCSSRRRSRPRKLIGTNLSRRGSSQSAPPLTNDIGSKGTIERGPVIGGQG